MAYLAPFCAFAGTLSAKGFAAMGATFDTPFASRDAMCVTFSEGLKAEKPCPPKNKISLFLTRPSAYLIVIHCAARSSAKAVEPGERSCPWHRPASQPSGCRRRFHGGRSHHKVPPPIAWLRRKGSCVSERRAFSPTAQGTSRRLDRHALQQRGRR